MPPHQPACLTIDSSVIKTLAILPFRILFTPWPVRRSVFLQALRGSRPLRRLNLKAFNPPTGQALETYFQKHGQPLQCVDVDCGAQFPSCTIHQISLATASPGPRCSLVFFHGGGYLSPLAGNAHCPMALSIASAAKCASVFFLEYNLAPEAPYPTQLVQAAYALMYLMRDRQIPPEQLVLAGDSVGAHLILSILAHAVQSHPLAPPIGPWVNKAHSFRAAALISPLVQATSSWDSFAENDGRDYLGYENIDRIAKGWAPSSSEVYANLLLPPTTVGPSRPTYCPLKQTCLDEHRR